MNDRPQVRFGHQVYVSPIAYVCGDLLVGDQCTFMHHVVVRADIAPIRIGHRVNIQDGSVVHTPSTTPLDIADDVGVGHRAIVHCRRIASRTLIGMGSILLDDCEIGSRCIIAAGAVLPPGTIIPDGKMVMGVPAKIVRDITDDDLRTIDHVVQAYIALGRRFAEGQFPSEVPSR